MNQQAMLKKIKKMQDEMVATQQEINDTVFYANAGGVVSVEMYGTKELKKVNVSEDFEAEGKDDYEVLGDMIVAACNQAVKEIELVTEEKMSKYQSMLGGFGF